MSKSYEEMTNAEKLEAIEKAINAHLVGGSQYSIGSRSVTRADLGKLIEMKNDLEAQINKADSDTLFENTYVARFAGR